MTEVLIGAFISLILIIGVKEIAKTAISPPLTEKQEDLINALEDEVECLLDEFGCRDNRRDIIEEHYYDNHKAYYADANKNTASVWIDYLIRTKKTIRKELEN